MSLQNPAEISHGESVLCRNVEVLRRQRRPRTLATGDLLVGDHLPQALLVHRARQRGPEPVADEARHPIDREFEDPGRPKNERVATLPALTAEFLQEIREGVRSGDLERLVTEIDQREAAIAAVCPGDQCVANGDAPIMVRILVLQQCIEGCTAANGDAREGFLGPQERSRRKR
jgi:hypothetical protein